MDRSLDNSYITAVKVGPGGRSESGLDMRLFGDENQSRSIAVQAVQRVKDKALPSCFIIISHRVGEGYCGALPGDRVDKLSDRFLADEQVVVFVANIEGHGDGFDGGGFR